MPDNEDSKGTWELTTGTSQTVVGEHVHDEDNGDFWDCNATSSTGKSTLSKKERKFLLLRCARATFERQGIDPKTGGH